MGSASTTGGRLRRACVRLSVRIDVRARRASGPGDLRGTAASGQSSVEYALVVAAFLALIVALGVMWRLFEDGTVSMHALQSASHHLKDAATGAWGDVFLY